MMKDFELQSRLAENMKRLRKNKKITQFELAEKADVSEMTVKKIETCKQWPSEKTLVQISNALGVDAYNLFLPVTLSQSERRKIQNGVCASLLEEFKGIVKASLDLL